jgi:hypothetical protein
VNRLVSQMRGERTRLDSLRHGHLDVRASLSLSYHALHPDTQQLLRRLGDLDLPEAATWTSAALLDTTTTRAEELLEELLDAQLAQATRNDPAGHARYRLHDLVRLFATELAARDDADQLEAARLRTYSSCLHLARAAYRSVCGGDYLTVLGEAPPWRIEQEHTAALVAEPMRWFDNEMTTVAALTRRAAADGHTAVCWQLATTVSLMFQMGRHFDPWERRKARQDSSRRPGGGTRCVRRILRMVHAATRCPSLRNSPWMRTTPQVRFSPASRRTRVTTSSLIGGRPVVLGWVHFLATSRLCQRSRVPGVTIRRPRSAVGSSLDSAASTARSGQRKHGFRFPRRNTATSWRNASNSASFDADERASSASQDKTTANRR